MLWGLAIVSLLAFATAFAAHSPAFLGFCLFVGFASGIGAMLIFIDRHLRASSRPEHMTERELQALRAMHRPHAPAPKQLPPSHDA